MIEWWYWWLAWFILVSWAGRLVYRLFQVWEGEHEHKVKPFDQAVSVVEICIWWAVVYTMFKGLGVI